MSHARTTLTPVSPLALRVHLATVVSELRTAEGLTQGQLAAKIGQVRQVVTRLENPLSYLGRSLAGDHVRAVLLACGLPASDPRHQEIMELMWSARAEGWWTAHPDMGERQRLIANIEQGAALICEYHPYLPPGLAQTRAFALHGAGADEDARVSAEAIADGRMRRQEAVFSSGVTYQLVLEELAIRRPIAPPRVMREQLHHLVELGRTPDVSVRVLPIDAPLGVGDVPTSPCSIYSYSDPRLPRLGVVDTFHMDHVISDPEQVHTYAQLFEQLRHAALSDADSAAFIKQVADGLPAGGS